MKTSYTLPIAAIIAVAQLLTPSAAMSSESEEDLGSLAKLYAEDQTARSEENLAAGLAPTLAEERQRRLKVLELVAEDSLRTANDYMHACVILHHTSRISLGSGEFKSLGAENHVLAFHLARRARELGHEDGRNMMAAAYNYYLRACGEDAVQYGFDFKDGKIRWRPGLSAEEKEVVKCDFEPRKYFNLEF
jgi:hypothetical protein